MTMLKQLTLGTSVILLTACGGGGSGGGVSSSTPMIGTTTNTKPTINTSTTPTPFNFYSDFKASKVSNLGKQVVPSDQYLKAKEVLEHTNRLRAEKGLPALKYDETLSAYAQVRALEVQKSNLFNHKRPDGSGFGTGLTVVGKYAYGENLVAGTGTDTAQEAVTEWRNSTTHYQNILNSNYTTLGVGVVYVPNSTYKYYWVQIFGTENVASDYFFDGGKKVSNNKPLEKLVIDKVSIPLIASNGTWRNVSGNNYQGAVNGYQNTRFGAVKLADETKAQVFYQGLQTPVATMPKSGVAHYNGTAVTVNGNNQLTTGLTSQFTANFGNKTLNGGIYQNNAQLVGIQATINGNTFQNTANAKVETQGAFFGNNAEELAGVFRDTQTQTTGAFGAKK